MAHTICFPNIDFSMCDVDWLLLFGARSLENLMAAPVRFGRCRALIVGSPYLVDGACHAAPLAGAPSPPRILWIAQYLHGARRATLMADLERFACFASRHGDWPIAIRLHPLDRGETRAFLEPRAPRLQWLTADELLPRIVDRFDVVAGSFSAGLVDAAACAKPVVAFATSGLVHALGIGDAGLPLVDDDEELERAIKAIAADYSRYSAAALDLARMHYHGLDDATPRVADVVAAFASGRDVSQLGLPLQDVNQTL
jgi:hypothetical protein